MAAVKSVAAALLIAVAIGLPAMAESGVVDPSRRGYVPKDQQSTDLRRKQFQEDVRRYKAGHTSANEGATSPKSFAGGLTASGTKGDSVTSPGPDAGLRQGSSSTAGMSAGVSVETERPVQVEIDANKSRGADAGAAARGLVAFLVVVLAAVGAWLLVRRRRR